LPPPIYTPDPAPNCVKVQTGITAGALIAAIVGLSRIYLRAHYASDVIAGEALAVAMYTLATLGVLAWQVHR